MDSDIAALRWGHCNGLMDRNIKICSWNICGAKDKLNNDSVLKFLHKYDIVWILEVKYIATTRIPGSIVYHNASQGGSHRGGVMLLVKYEIKKYLLSVKLDFDSQIWLELSFYPNIYIGGIYDPPETSPYSDPTIMANLSTLLNDNRKIIVLGDFNGRVAKPVISDKEGYVYEYINTVDSRQNNQGKKLINTCIENSLVIANHLKYKNKCFGGNLSYKQKDIWKSEIDLCIIHKNLLPLLKKLK